MKKSLFFAAAASALMLTACSSENDVVQNAPQTQETTAQAVDFDIYTPAATDVTRAGLSGTMTTGRLQFSEAYGGGFGVYAYQVQDALNDATATKYEDWMSRATPAQLPNFMVNEKLLWNTVNQGWYYNPLKYWPNETNNDSQNTNASMESITGNKHLDRLTFFAYAPYVATAKNNKPGISYVTSNTGVLNTKADGTGTAHASVTSVLEPSIAYQAAVDDPNKAVDLLWGVAPAGGLTYTAVNGLTVKVDEGMPLIDMTKPDVNTNMKFLFQHALARIGVKAVAAIDQIGAGGKLDPNTKITIEKITLKGYFGETGILNLDNTIANVANWRYINDVDLSSKAAATDVATTTLPQRTLTLAADHTTPADGTIATHLQWVDADGTYSPTAPDAQTDRVGVTTVKQDVIQPSTNFHCVSSIVATAEKPLYYSESTPYYTTWTRDAGVSGLATTQQLSDRTYFTYGEDGSWTKVKVTSGSPAITYQYPADIKHYVATVEDGATSVFTIINTAALAEKYAAYTAYIKSGDKFIPVADVPENGKDHYVLTATMAKVQPTYAPTTYYKRDANYFMVVPTNNVANICTALTPAEQEKLRTVRVMIEYYITTEDGKLNADRAQSKNVIEKDVVFPSLANGKSYNLNLVLGLTSVKMEAEVDDWKVINVQGDLPQNTSN
jgi:hypothetical protein